MLALLWDRPDSVRGERGDDADVGRAVAACCWCCSGCSCFRDALEVRVGAVLVGVAVAVAVVVVVVRWLRVGPKGERGDRMGVCPLPPAGLIATGEQGVKMWASV